MVRVVVVGAALTLLHLLLYRRLVRATALRGAPAVVATLAIALLGLLALVGMGSGSVLDPAWARPLGWWAWAWLGTVAYLLLGFAVVGVVLLALRLARVRAASPKAPGRPRALRAVYGTVLVVALTLVGYGTTEARDVRVTHATVELPGLPAGFDGLRVAVVADLHVGPARGGALTRQVVDLVNAQRPDLVVLPGDLTDGTVALVGGDLGPLADLDAPLGVFGAAGNHEGYADSVGSWLDHWEILGVTALRNSRATVERGGDLVDIVGVNDYAAPDPYAADLPAALAGLPGGRFTLLVAHQPAQVHEAAELGVDLQVSGHTHGGQMWPFNHLAGLANPTLRGVDRFGGTTVYTTVGAGTWGPPVRVGVRPEVVVLELRSA